MFFATIVLCIFAKSVFGEESSNNSTNDVVIVNSTRIARDSYLEAYAALRNDRKRMDRDSTGNDFGNGYPEGPAAPQYPQFPNSYAPPKAQYGLPAAPVNNYGPPAPSYGSPVPSYGPPAPSYGPPPPPLPVYGPPLEQSYGIPYGMLSILDKLKFKLDLITILKIMLKVILFKKLVGFIAIICLLLFIPWIKAKKHYHHHHNNHNNHNNNNNNNHHDEDYGDEEMRNIKHVASIGDSRVNNIGMFVLEAIDNFTGKYQQSEKCDTVYCRTMRTVKEIDERLPNDVLARQYTH